MKNAGHNHDKGNTEQEENDPQSPLYQSIHGILPARMSLCAALSGDVIAQQEQVIQTSDQNTDAHSHTKTIISTNY